MSFKTRSKKRAQRRQQKQAHAANAMMDEFFRRREAWKRVQGRRVTASEEQRTAVGEAKSRRRGSREAVET